MRDEILEQTLTLLGRLNEEITAENWPSICLRQPVPAGRKVPDGGFAGVRTFEECVAIREEFREEVARWIALTSRASLKARRLKSHVWELAQLEIENLSFVDDSCGVDFQWRTKDDTYRQQLYAVMIFAMQCTRRRQLLHRCIGCKIFFFESEPRHTTFCTPACRNRTNVKRSRERQKKERGD